VVVLVIDTEGDIDGVGEGKGVDVSVTFCSCRLPLVVATESTSSTVELVITSITAQVKPPPVDTEINDVGVTDVLHVSVVTPPPLPLEGVEIIRDALIVRGISIFSGTVTIDDEVRPEKLVRSPQQYSIPLEDIAHV
jgi:hypothetical protein